MPSTTGERQIGTKQKEIAINHRARYEWAGNVLRERLPKGAHVLDAACGCAYGSQMLAEMGFKVTCYDRSAEALEWSRFFTSPNVRFVQADVMDALKDNQKYDAAVSIETIEHIKNDQAWIDGLFKAVPYLVGTVPNQNVVAFDIEKHPFHYRHYTKPEVIELFKDWELSEWSTQYAKYENYWMRPGDDGMTLGFLAKR
jgi:O-antigen biosynthesis protein